MSSAVDRRGHVSRSLLTRFVDDMKRHLFHRRHATTGWNFSKTKPDAVSAYLSRASLSISTRPLYWQTEYSKRAVKLTVPCRILVRV